MSWGGNYSQSNASEPACYCVPYLHWAQGGGVEGWTIILVVHQKMKKKSSWSPSSHQPGNPKPGVGSQRGIQGEEQCGSLCKRGRENKPFPLERDHVRAPSEKTTQGRSEPFLLCTARRRRRGGAHLDGHTLVHNWTCTALSGGEKIWDVAHQAFAESNTLSSNSNTLWSKTKSTTVFCVLRLSWDNMAIWSGFQAAYRPSTTLEGWRTGCRVLSTRGGRTAIQC